MWTLSHEAFRKREAERVRVNERNKSQNLDPITEYELDLRCFSWARFAGPTKWEYLLRCWGHQWPDFVEIEKNWKGVTHQNYWLIRMAKAFCKYKRLILLGCASSGKSFGSAAYVYTLWKAGASMTSAYLSTTSGEAGEARAWGTVKDLHNRDKMKVGKLINSLRVITLDEETRNEEGEKERDYRNCLKAVLIKPGADGKNVVGTICGRKNERVVWHCDELAFMDTGVLDARINLFSNPFAQFIGIGNGPEEGDPLYIDGEPVGDEFPDGWRSVDKDLHEGWPTRVGYCLYFNGEKSPNLHLPAGCPPLFDRIMDAPKKQEIYEVSGGEDNPYFWKQFYGFPPTVDVPDKIVTYKLLEKNGAFLKPEWTGAPRKTVAGLDLGFREDGDPCVADFMQVGPAITTPGNSANPNPVVRTIAGCEPDGIVLNPSQKDGRDFETQIAHRFIDACEKRNCHDAALDVTGDGGIMLQAVERVARERNYKLNVVAVSFSGLADDQIVIPGQRQTAREMFDRKVSQLWASFRLAVQNGSVRGCIASSKAVSQLCGRRYSTDEKKRFTVESKKEMKKRLKRSPDHGDARCLALFMALKMGLSGPIPTDSERVRQKREEWEEKTEPTGYSGHGELNGYSGH